MTKNVTIVGQGYVGLPLAQSASGAGWKVRGLDLSEALVRNLNRGLSHVDDISEQDVRQMLGRGYKATTDTSCIKDSDVVLLCVPTPLGEGGAPDLSAVESAGRMVGKNLKPGALVVLESTTYPGTTEEVLGPLLEVESGMRVGEDFRLAFSPERVDPGNAKFGIKNTPKLVGGVNPDSTGAAVRFYSDFVDEVVPLSGTREAETAKLLENTFRHVNIALVNEMAKFCHELDIDIWEVIRGAATKPFGFMRFTPGPGVGGHCIPIDPNYLSYEVRKQLGYPFRFVELAQEINNSMPSYVVARVTEMLNEKSKAVKDSNVLILGVTYKPDIADQRESPAPLVADLLMSKGAKVRFHDPYVRTWQLGTGEATREEDFIGALAESDIVLLLQPHRAYDLALIEHNAPLLLDTQGATENGTKL